MTRSVYFGHQVYMLTSTDKHFIIWLDQFLLLGLCETPSFIQTSRQWRIYMHHQSCFLFNSNETGVLFTYYNIYIKNTNSVCLDEDGGLEGQFLLLLDVVAHVTQLLLHDSHGLEVSRVVERITPQEQQLEPYSENILFIIKIMFCFKV